MSIQVIPINQNSSRILKLKKRNAPNYTRMIETDGFTHVWQNFQSDFMPVPQPSEVGVTTYEETKERFSESSESELIGIEVRTGA